MVRIYLTFYVFVWVFLCFDVTGIDVVAEYRLWDSPSRQIIYDYSGNLRHGKFSNSGTLIFTDRGVSTLDSIILTGIPINSTPVEGFTEFALSFWALLIQGGYSVKVHLQGGSTDIITCAFYEGMVHFYSAVRSYLHFSTMAGWNLLTIIFRITPKRLDLYHNLVFLDYLDSSLQGVNSFSIHFVWQATIYEVWAHTGLSSISDLNYLKYNSCPASYGSPCPPVYDRFKNKKGASCPTECTSNSLSCDSNLSCIGSDQNSCLYGLYEIKSGDCIIYCPEDSCTCSQTFECSCKIGFKKITEEFVGCVPESWVNYHKEGYIYVSDKFEAGYSLDSHGNCCICEEGYTVVSSIPFVCMIMPNCLAFTQEGDTYKCSQCTEGFRIDSEGLCLECSEGYERISDDSIECIPKIDRCQEYIYIDEYISCSRCKAGYRVSSSGKCDECQEGYFKVQGSSLLCLSEIERCTEYDISSEYSKCISCEAGYMLDSEYICSSCEIDYVEVLSNTLSCAYKRDKCTSYELYEGDWVCNSCEAGYKLNDERKCGECADGYKSQSAEILECVLNNESTSYTSDNSDNIEKETEAYKEEGMIKNSVTITKVAISTSAAASMISLNLDSVFSIIGTTQLLSYILLYNLSIPAKAEAILGGISIINIVPNLFEYFIPAEDTLNIPRYGRADINTELFLINSGKMLTIILFSILVIIAEKLLHHLTQKLNDSNRIKKILGKLLLTLEWNFVIGSLIQGTLELSISSLINIYYVTFSDTHSVVGFCISIIVLVRYI